MAVEEEGLRVFQSVKIKIGLYLGSETTNKEVCECTAKEDGILFRGNQWLCIEGDYHIAFEKRNA